MRLACSWNLPAGQECVFAAEFFGTQGGARFENVHGSFYDFRAVRFHGTRTEVLADAPDHWGGRALLRWTEELARGSGYSPEIEGTLRVSRTLDEIYGR